MDSPRKEGSKAKLFRGAAILAGASLFARLLGAVYRIPLAGMLGDEGVGLFEMANPIYFFLLSISVAGIPLAISKLIAERKAVSDGAGARKVLRVSVVMMAASGVGASLALFILAPYIADRVYHDPRAVLPLRAISPSLAFMTVMSAMRGYFQGVQKMAPSAISQVTEQLARVGFMLLAAFLLLPRGVEFAAGGAAGGAAIGGLVGLAFIVSAYFLMKGKPEYSIPEGGSKAEKGTVIAGRILQLSVPVALTNSLASIKSLIDAAIVPGRLAAAGFKASEATALYGQYNGMAFPIAYFPTAIIAGLASATVPSVSEANARGDKEAIRERAIYVLKLTSLIAFPASIGLLVLASPITGLLFGKPEVGPVLAALSMATAFLCLQQTSSSILSGMGHVLDPFRSAIIGIMVKVALEFYLTSLPGLNVRGAAVSTVAGSLVTVVLNLVQLEKRLGIKVGYARAFWRPALSSAAMGAVVLLSHGIVDRAMGHSRLSALPTIALGGLFYMAAILFLGGMSPEELEAIPVIGRRAAALSAKLGYRRRR
ncbi:MAG TPA: polysaccharide biosynthesis protein [Bacillota bacterium]|nr:polysaccharide biosynthesis protein [Bacillota bacterium]HOG53420.1 polysaccharide biosynthesis protein [Bacillota bacterium]